MKFIWVALLLCLACTDPDMGVVARVLRVEEVDGVTSRVVFEARASGPLWWRLELMDYGYLFDYGKADVVAVVPVRFNSGFRFWLDFVAWTALDTARATYINDPR